MPTWSFLCKTVIICLFSGFLPYSIFAQSATSTLSGTSFTTQALGGSSYSWNNTSRAETSNDSYASASAIVGLLSGNTNYLVVTGFGFSIPPGSEITGIKVEIEKSGTNIGLFTSIKDNDIRIVKNGTIAGNNKASGTKWTDSDAYYTYGGSNDKWGTSWSLTDINSNFGVAISADISGVVGLFPSARIDHVRATVYYNLVLPVFITSFTILAANNTVKLNWQTSDAFHGQIFSIQRSEDGTNWESLLGTIQHDQSFLQFEFIDYKPTRISYYRIKTETREGKISYTDIRKVQLPSSKQSNVYPNPATHTIYIPDGVNQGIKIYTMTGQLVRNYEGLSEGNKIDISGLQPGLYCIIINNQSKRTLFQKK